jgi:hypothetical protein
MRRNGSHDAAIVHVESGRSVILARERKRPVVVLTG